MSDLFRHRTALVWAALVLLTLVSWIVGPPASAGLRLGTAIALVIAFVKVRYVGLEFMELRHSAVPLRAAFEAWVLIVGATTTVLYLVG